LSGFFGAEVCHAGFAGQLGSVGRRGGRQRLKAQLSLTFQLALHAGGTAGPMINALIAPMLRPVAEDFANKIARQVETLRAG